MKLLASLLLIVIASPAVADGMMLRVGPVPGVPDLPYQRAVVSYRDGMETLIVDSRLGGGEKGDHVWVLPLPGAPTTIEPVETSYLDAVFAAGAPMIQGSAKARADEVVYFIVLAIVSVPYLLRVRDPVRWRRMATYALLLIAILLPLSLLMPVYGGFGTKVAGFAVGGYDVVALDPEEPADPLAWLREKGAKVPERAAAVIEDYRRRGWSLFVMKFVRRTGYEQPHPLRFVFPAKVPVYPMRLTGSASRYLVLDLVVIGDQRAAVKGLTLWSGVQGLYDEERSRYVFWPGAVVLVEPSSREFWQDCWLTSFRGEFGAKTMEQDIEIGWTKPERFRARFYDQAGRRGLAASSFAICAGAALLIGSLAALFTPRARAWLPWVLLATVAAGGMAAGFAFLTAPVLDEATGRLLGHG